MSQSERLRVLFSDHLSLPRGKLVPGRKAQSGETMVCQSLFGVQFDKDLLPAPGSKMMQGLPDMAVTWNPDDIRESWVDGEKIVVAELKEMDGSAHGCCPRGALKRAVADWDKLGLKPFVGIELEATAFQFNEDGGLEPYDTPGGYVYGTGPFSDPAGFTDAIWERAEAAGFALDMIATEYFTPQFEFTLTFDNALKAVDDIFLFKLLAREVALEHGILLTFLPLPIEDIGGIGMHINFSFQDKEGKNVIGGGKQLGAITEGCIAGLIRHHRPLAALLCPTVTSYNRLQPSALAGVWANWGVNHRGVTTRASEAPGKSARLEHRMADVTSNPYTATAAVLQASRLGVVDKLPLPPAETGDCMERQDATIKTPDTLAEALAELKADTALTKAVGQDLVDNLIFMKTDEIEKTKELSGTALRDWYIHYL
ncbi:MAG: glutamine synthetase [Rhodobacteraceae bacterium]|nr:glutamine synthetase [Paracoccaceae bacterium]